MIFIKIINFLNKIGPLWAHKGPYGPIKALWAHMGLKKFLTQAQLCNFLISAMGCNEQNPAPPRSIGKPSENMFFVYSWYSVYVFILFFMFFHGKTVFSGFFDAKPPRTITCEPETSVLNPKCAKLNQKSDFGHVRTYCWLNALRNIQRKIYQKYLGHIYIYMKYIRNI